MLPLLSRISDLAYQAYRCRVVNRAFGSQLAPDAIEALIPDEDITLLSEMAEHDYLDDPVTLLKLLLKVPRV